MVVPVLVRSGTRVRLPNNRFGFIHHIRILNMYRDNDVKVSLFEITASDWYGINDSAWHMPQIIYYKLQKIIYIIDIMNYYTLGSTTSIRKNDSSKTLSFNVKR